ncbi:DgyrCDS9347 [Dimorphilus gyrociliatus]|uniref:DgyrCDS9347 n=1 Tax=Dimorphilus gyrociliatus TaxID=2664684 RepID=A0A7I8VWQ7_9ANNE|nr:DgyrCDS9347 [Dimorphilus gyrociliatus]
MPDSMDNNKSSGADKRRTSDSKTNGEESGDDKDSIPTAIKKERRSSEGGNSGGWGEDESLVKPAINAIDSLLAEEQINAKQQSSKAQPSTSASSACKMEIEPNDRHVPPRPILAVPPVQQHHPPPLISTQIKEEVKDVWEKPTPVNSSRPHGPPPPLKRLENETTPDINSHKLNISSTQTNVLDNLPPRRSSIETLSHNSQTPNSEIIESPTPSETTVKRETNVPDTDEEAATSVVESTPEVVDRVEKEYANAIIIRRLDRGGNSCSRTDLIYAIKPGSKFAKRKAARAEGNRHPSTKSAPKEEKIRKTPPENKTADAQVLSHVHMLNNRPAPPIFNSDTPALHQLRAYSDRAYALGLGQTAVSQAPYGGLNMTPDMNQRVIYTTSQSSRERLEAELLRDKQERDAREREMRERELREIELQEKMKRELEMKPGSSATSPTATSSQVAEAQFLQMQRDYALRGLPLPPGPGLLHGGLTFPVPTGIYPPDILQRERERALAERMQAERSMALNDPLARLHMHPLMGSQSFPTPPAGYPPALLERDTLIQRQLIAQQMHHDLIQRGHHFAPH